MIRMIPMRTLTYFMLYSILLYTIVEGRAAHLFMSTCIGNSHVGWVIETLTPISANPKL